ncbi:MAG: 2-hydroxyacyl-CoA dehydratase [Clostridia bacterium]|nr:2-hydroxyacyl-CoA dehydratase [Clostridia bacterium]NCC69173.1 2-hydroxyacyl-CoA dehydratase [Clostridia bacterium]
MRDLKHLIAFENLLQEAQNELVTKAALEGKIALGYTCYYIPEVLLNLDGCFSVRLRAPRCTSTDVATYYLTNRNCPFSRSILERAIEGGYNFLGALFGSETCAAMERAQEHFFILNPVKNDDFFVTIIDSPLKDDKTSLEYYKTQLKLKVLEPLSEHYGIDISDAALRKAIEEHNEICRLITEIGNYRKLRNPPITGYEFHVIQLVSQVCPQELIKPYLEETLEEIRTREPEAEFPFRACVVLVGSEVDDPDFTKLIEECGAMVVADRYCFGSIPSREEIFIKEGETAFDAICRHYLETNECPRFMSNEKISHRHQLVKHLVEEFGADGVIYENMKFCEFWSYEKVLGSHILTNEMKIPCCTIEKEYSIGSVGQLRTRFQAFVESLEIKKIVS